MKRYFILAGEPSGDLHGSRLMKAMKQLDSDIEFIGIGGERMIAEGLESIASHSEISVVGFWEVIRKYGFFKNLLERCKKIISESDLDAFIPIDYPGLNVRLAKHSNKVGVKVFYYIAPQLWAWGKNRAKKLLHCTDKLFVVFPFEKDFFEGFGIKTEFVGHPLLDDPIFSDNFLDFASREKLIAFLPGSRNQEIKKHLPLISEVMSNLKQKLPDYRIAIAKSPLIEEQSYRELIENYDAELWKDSRELMKIAKVGIVKTGTSNLEAALLSLPHVMFYKTSMFTYQMGKHLINLPYISLVNILQNKTIVKELIQSDATPEKITNELMRLIEKQNDYEIMQKEFSDIRKLLGSSGASEKTARIILNET